MGMRLLIYCRRDTDLACLEAEGFALYTYATEQGNQIDGMILELDAGIWLERPGIYELLRQLQGGKAEGILLRNLSAFGVQETIQQKACALLYGYPLLLADIDSF